MIERTRDRMNELFPDVVYTAPMLRRKLATMDVLPSENVVKLTGRQIRIMGERGREYGVASASEMVRKILDNVIKDNLFNAVLNPED